MSKTDHKKEAEAPQAAFQLIHQYAKDVSAECFVSRTMTDKDVKVSLDVGLASRAVKDDMFEVILKLRLEGKAEDKPAYMVETEYVGEFLAKGLEPERIQALLAVDGASLIFPFARQIMMNSISSLGYQVRMIEPINFAALYMHNQKMQQNTTDGKQASA